MSTKLPSLSLSVRYVALTYYARELWKSKNHIEHYKVLKFLPFHSTIHCL